GLTENDQPLVNTIKYLREFALEEQPGASLKRTVTIVQGPVPTVLMPLDYRIPLFGRMGRIFNLVLDQWCDNPAGHREVWCP
ncbi:putative 1-phosphatidylinositol-3-phosphate 5-kinase FAB1D, partial [Taenia solium]